MNTTTTTTNTYCYCIVLPKPLLLLVQAVDCIWFSISQLLLILGLTSPSNFSLLAPSWDHVYLNSSPDLRAPSTPSPSPPTSSSMSILSHLPVLHFSNFINNKRRITRISSSYSGGEGEEEDHLCAVCLGILQGSDEVRELGRCNHVFHKECIDKWVENGHQTCPLCRSELLPPENIAHAKGPLFVSLLRRLQ
ncbi:hypothetical protein J5N97_021794 [Dioscorea zingiberensis]|uniref:RING-type domain-containing protein n=1 Tax=Dioscorea zingiberensis TaxID=325984 RepID=A0A9D5C8Z7_9LILI|nr:hypothetical protein J5N97_021794 [Dioscorea zingiberensis]